MEQSGSESNYALPSPTLLSEDISQKEKVNTRNAKAKLEEILSNLKIDGHVIKVTGICCSIRWTAHH